MRNSVAALIASAFLAGPALAEDVAEAWCAPDEPEIFVGQQAVYEVDYTCKPGTGGIVFGQVMNMHCESDNGPHDTQMTLTLSGDTLTVTEAGYSTTYHRCPNP